VVESVDKKTGVVTKRPLKGLRGNYVMALNEEDHRLFTIIRKTPMMVFLDTQSSKEVARLRAAAECDDVFFDVGRKRIYVIGGEGIISVFQQNDPDHYELVANVPLRWASVRDITLQNATAFTARCQPKATNQPRCGRSRQRISERDSSRLNRFVSIYSRRTQPHRLTSRASNIILSRQPGRNMKRLWALGLVVLLGWAGRATAQVPSNDESAPLVFFDCSTLARAIPRWANAPVEQFHTATSPFVKIGKSAC
jgi:hypothetical protein